MMEQVIALLQEELNTLAQESKTLRDESNRLARLAAEKEAVIAGIAQAIKILSM